MSKVVDTEGKLENPLSTEDDTCVLQDTLEMSGCIIRSFWYKATPLLGVSECTRRRAPCIQCRGARCMSHHLQRRPSQNGLSTIHHRDTEVTLYES